MARKNAWFTGLATLAPVGGLLVALAAAPAHADAVLTVSDGTNTLTLPDNGTGIINYSGMLDAWQLDFSWALTEPALGTVHQPDMHLTAGMLGQGTLNITFTDDSFIGTGSQEFLSSIGGSLGGGASLTSGGSWLLDGSGNKVTQLASFGPFSGTGGFSDTQSAVDSVGGSYGLELFATLTQNQITASSLDSNVAVPEPSTLALFGAGLLGCGLLVGGRRRRAPAAI